MKIEKITQSEIDMEKGLGFILGKIINKQNEIIDALQGEGEKCGVFRDHSEGIPCQNPKGSCPVHDMTHRDKMLQQAPSNPQRDKLFADASLPQPVSTVEGWEEVCKKLNLREETASGFDEQAYLQNYISNLIAQVREEARGKYTGNINDDLNTFVVNYSKGPYRKTDENDDMDDDSI